MKQSLRPPYLATAALSGALFGAGLYIAQMTNPLKVLRFLDFTAIPTGGWDPSLALVMGGGLIVMLAAVQYGKRMERPLFNGTFHQPEYNHIDLPLVAGSALFGIGWGMSGICPGPAISLLAFLPENIWVFLCAMFVGSYLGSFVMKRIPREVVPA
ncbi:MAG TPA: DUF6691 family protein [Devosia sp.]